VRNLLLTYESPASVRRWPGGERGAALIAVAARDRGHLHLYFSVRESDREQAPSVAQLHQNRRLPEIVAGPGSSEQLVGSAAKQDGNLATHNV
jgi:hypothetical protein